MRCLIFLLLLLILLFVLIIHNVFAFMSYKSMAILNI